MRRWLRPTLELVGIYGGVKDGIKTIVPATATLKVVARLVPNQSPAKVLQVGCPVPSWAAPGPLLDGVQICVLQRASSLRSACAVLKRT